MRAEAWRDRDAELVDCARCGRSVDQGDVDRLLWCEPCRVRARARASRRGWTVGAMLGLVLALWIWLVVQPSDLVIGGWIATVVAAVWIGAKVAREIAYGVDRARRGPHVDS